MAKVEGLNQRGNRWYVRIIIPDDVRAFYDKARVNVALGTSDRREATLLALIKRAEWLADFAAKRSQLNPSAIAAVSPQLAALLAERVRAAVLAEDDRVRWVSFRSASTGGGQNEDALVPSVTCNANQCADS